MIDNPIELADDLIEVAQTILEEKVLKTMPEHEKTKFLEKLPFGFVKISPKVKQSSKVVLLPYHAYPAKYDPDYQDLGHRNDPTRHYDARRDPAKYHEFEIPTPFKQITPLKMDKIPVSHLPGEMEIPNYSEKEVNFYDRISKKITSFETISSLLEKDIYCYNYAGFNNKFAYSFISELPDIPEINLIKLPTTYVKKACSFLNENKKYILSDEMHSSAKLVKISDILKMSQEFNSLTLKEKNLVMDKIWNL